jgi:hypothetical protein
MSEIHFPISALFIEFESILNRFVEIRKIFAEVRTDLRNGFTSLRNFDQNRVAILESVTRKVSFSEVSPNCSVGTSTMFYVFYRGKFGALLSPHFNCSGLSPYPAERILTDETHDIAVVMKALNIAVVRCTVSGMKALNITQMADMKLGDDVILYGHGDTAIVSKGILSGYANDDCGPATPWHGNMSICRGELLVQSYQHSGFSGAAVANGCGLTGMAHGFSITSSGAVFAAVIGAKVIQALVSKFYSKLSECVDSPVVNLPHFPFSSCRNNDDAPEPVISEEAIAAVYLVV